MLYAVIENGKSIDVTKQIGIGVFGVLSSPSLTEPKANNKS